MKRSFLANICCPVCRESFELKQTEGGAENVIEGTLHCRRCATDYPIRKGIPNLLPENGWGASKAPEMEGWVNLWQKKGMYDIPGPSTDSFQLPYIGGGWSEFARMFDLACQELNLQGTEMILDLGAGQGWASRYFAEKGCQAVAMDIVADEWWGLGRSWAIMEHAGVYFEPVLADGENLPFLNEKFDIIFASAALHHFDKLNRVLAQIYQILKPGGRLIAVSEPSISIFLKEYDILPTLEETQEGIVERRPKTFQYWLNLKRAGFAQIQIDTFETYQAPPTQVYHWIKTLRHHHYQTGKSLQNIMAWLAYSLALRLPYRWAARLTLSLNGGNLFIRAVKPGKV